MLRRLRSDEGFTLAELIMYCLILSVVLSVAAGIMISGSIAEKTVRVVVGATTESQLTADNIETGIRNSSGYTLTVPTLGGQLVRARVAQGTTETVWVCAAWYYSPTVQNGSLWYKASTTETSVAAPTASGLSTWTLLANDVKPGTGSDVFSTGSNQLLFSFTTEAGNDPPASVTSSAASRAETWEVGLCS
jgi:competence protein ComGC